MATGKRKKVMISCVTFETVKITDPVRFYDVDKVHLIHYIKDEKSETGTIYREFYDKVCSVILKDSNGAAEIVEHRGKINHFLSVMQSILNIIESELNSDEPVDLYVNISAGTSEYTAAAVIASMMNPNVIPFSVSTEQYSVKTGDIRKIYYKGGEPVGLTESVYEPSVVPKYTMPMPDRTLVLGLRATVSLSRGRYLPKGPAAIRELKEKGLWRVCELSLDPPGTYGREAKRSDSVYYHRDFVSKWVLNKWIEKDEFNKRYVLTEEGQRIIDTFYLYAASMDDLSMNTISHVTPINKHGRL